jgi:hypothetical protein
MNRTFFTSSPCSFGSKADYEYKKHSEKLFKEICELEEFLHYDEADTGEWAKAYERLKKIFPKSEILTGLMDVKYRLIKMSVNH